MRARQTRLRSGAVNLNIDLEGADRALSFLRGFGRQAEGPIVNALNRAIQGIKTDSVDEARNIYNVKARAIRERVKLTRAKRGSRARVADLSGKVQFKGTFIPLYEFGARPRQPKPKKPPKVGASVKVKHETGRKKIPGAFVADLPVRGRNLYYRPGKERDKVLKFYSVSVPQMVDDEQSVARISDGAQQRFEKNLDHEIERFFIRRGLR